MNGFAALDIPPCRRYVVVKATAGFAVCRLILKLLLFYSCLDFTQNLGETRLNLISLFANHVVHFVNILLAGVVIRCFHHHTHQRIDAGFPNKDASGVPQHLCHSLDDSLHLRVILGGFFIAHSDIFQHLRIESSASLLRGSFLASMTSH